MQPLTWKLRISAATDTFDVVAVYLATDAIFKVHIHDKTHEITRNIFQSVIVAMNGHLASTKEGFITGYCFKNIYSSGTLSSNQWQIERHIWLKIIDDWPSWLTKRKTNIKHFWHCKSKCTGVYLIDKKYRNIRTSYADRKRMAGAHITHRYDSKEREARKYRLSRKPIPLLERSTMPFLWSRKIWWPTRLVKHELPTR